MIGFGGDPGFGMTFSIMRIMVPVIFVLVFGIIIVAMVRGIGEWNKNNHSPKLSVPAKVVSRRTAVSHPAASGWAWGATVTCTGWELPAASLPPRAPASRLLRSSPIPALMPSVT